MKNYLEKSIPYVLVAVLILFLALFVTNNKNKEIIIDLDESSNTEVQTEEKMKLSLFVQDKQAVRITDCGITKKVEIEVPRTAQVADASLKALFAEELSMYAKYKSVSIENAVAKVKLESGNTPKGSPLSSLSSCESIHLLSVINDTLTQYPSVKSVELYAPEGKIMF